MIPYSSRSDCDIRLVKVVASNCSASSVWALSAASRKETIAHLFTAYAGRTISSQFANHTDYSQRTHTTTGNTSAGKYFIVYDLQNTECYSTSPLENRLPSTCANTLLCSSFSSFLRTTIEHFLVFSASFVQVHHWVRLSLRARKKFRGCRNPAFDRAYAVVDCTSCFFLPALHGEGGFLDAAMQH